MTSLCLVAISASAFASPPATQPTGKSTATWPLPPDAEFEKSYTALGTRHGFRIPDNYPQKKRDEWLPSTGGADPTYELYVPRAYKPDGTYGLLVWISPGKTGKVPREEWLKALDKHRLIWVGPNHVGNDADTLLRTWMAVEAVRNAKQQFTLDEGRIFVAGMSGGGRIASHAAVVAADTFTGGGFYFCGCDFYRDVPVVPGDVHGKYYPGFWRKPDAKIVKLAKQHHYVLLTGSEDFNRGNTHAVLDGYEKANFPHVTLLDVPGLGHTVPNAVWFEKGLAFLNGAEGPASTTTAKASTRPTTRGVIRVGPEQKRVR